MKSSSGWYPQWRHEAVHQLMEKNDDLEKRYGINSYPRWDYDVDEAQLVFSKDDKPRVIAEIQIVGTTGSKDWLWSWGNDWWPEAITADARLAQQFGVEHDIAELSSPRLEDKSLVHLGWELTAATARLASSVGAYRPPGNNGYLFFVYRSVNFVS